MAQPPAYRFDRLTIDDGLSQNFINAVTQDYRGFMWFGTNDGLNRYDGSVFRIYNHEITDTNTLMDNKVTALFEDSRRDLWVGAGGLHRYDRLMDRFERVLTPEALGSPQSSARILDIVEDHNGDLWIAVEKVGLFRIEVAAPDKLTEGAEPGKHRPPGAYAVHGPYSFEDQEDPLHSYFRIREMLSTGRRLLVVSSKSVRSLGTGQNGRFPAPENALFTELLTFSATEEVEFGSLLEDDRGDIWVGSSNGLFHLAASGKPGEFRFFPFPEGWFGVYEGTPTRMVAAPAGTFWMSTYKGIVLFDPAVGSFELILDDPEDPAGLGFNGLTTLFVDAGSVIWIGSGGLGLSKFAGERKAFRHFLDKDRQKSVHSVYGILEDGDGHLWINLNGGFVRQFRRSADGSFLQLVSDAHRLRVTSNFLQDPEQRIWYCNGSILCRFDPATAQINTFPWIASQDFRVSGELKPVLHRDAAGQLWVCNTRNIYRFSPSSGMFEAYKLPFRELGEVNAVHRDAGGRFWLATAGGLLRFDLETGAGKLYEAQPGQPAGLKNNLLKCLLPDPFQPDRYLWIGSAGGLHRLDMETETFQTYTIRDGLANNFVYGILPDDAGRLWISTNRGLSCFDPAGGTFRNYFVEDGLQSNEFNTYAYYRSAGGELFFGGINGLTAFFPDQIRPNPHKPPVVLTDMQLSYESVRPGAKGSPLKTVITETKEVFLNHDQRTVAFEFAALDFTLPENNRYRYRLEGFDKGWIDAGTEKRATYTNLPPGDYTFRVQGANNDGAFNEQGASLQVHIARPPWMRWWAWLLYALVAGLAGFAVYRYLLEKRRARQALLEKEREAQRLAELDRFKSEFFAGISHEFRTPITLIEGRMEELLEELKRHDLREKVLSARQHAGALLRLVEQLLDIARLESGNMKLDLRAGDLAPFAEKLTALLQPLAANRGVSLDFCSAREPLIAAFDPGALQKILENLVVNAVKYTPAGGRVRVELAKAAATPNGLPQKERILIRVRDEGVGIPEADLPFIFDRYYQAGNQQETEKGFGLGLALVKELTRLHGGTVGVESRIGEGTTFTVALPAAAAVVASPVPLPEREVPEPAAGAANGAGMDHPWTSPDAPLILIVEDHDEMRAYISGILQPNYRVRQAADGRKGLEAAFEELPDLVLSDVMMPEMDGNELTRRLMEDPRSSHIPVVLLTARAEMEDRLKGLDLGADDYLVKPFRKEELLTRIRNILRKRELLKEKYASFLLGGPVSDDMETIDQAFLQQVRSTIEDNLDDENFGVDQLSEAFSMSRSNLYRKLQALTGYTTVQLIQYVRLEKAAALLKKGYGVSEVTYKVGFRSPSYFSNLFKKHYGCSPREYAGRR